MSVNVDPMPVFRQYAGRMDLAHFKDDVLLPDGTKQMMPLGQGSHDWRPILAACREAGVKYVFAEQERWNQDAFECAQDSFDYLREIGL